MTIIGDTVHLVNMFAHDIFNKHDDPINSEELRLQIVQIRIIYVGFWQLYSFFSLMAGTENWHRLGIGSIPTNGLMVLYAAFFSLCATISLSL